MSAALLLHADSLAALSRAVSTPGHALLLSGPAGIGKTIAATQLAAELLGLDVGAVASSPGFRRLAPTDRKISVDAVRSLGSFVQLKMPGGGDVARIIVIDDADAMTVEAQNALLKLLEEPPDRTVIVLTSSRPRALLRTVRSRVRELPLKLPAYEAIETYLLDRGYAQDLIEKTWRMHAGNLGHVIGTLEGSLPQTEVLDLVKQVLGGDTFIRLSLIDAQLKDKEAAREFVAVLTVVAGQSLVRSEDKLRWERVLEAAYTAQESLAKNGNQKLVLTELMLDL